LSPAPTKVGFSLPASVVAFSVPAILAVPTIMLEFVASVDALALSSPAFVVELSFPDNLSPPGAVTALSSPPFIVELSFPDDDLQSPS